MRRDRILSVVEVLVLLLTALFLFQALRGSHPESSDIRRYMVENGSEETGALNLVTGIYLGYRAFDTLGETIVLLVSVTGAVFFLRSAEGRDEETEDDHS
jgi:multicomponent Na+:H+ antiporter subunit B